MAGKTKRNHGARRQGGIRKGGAQERRDSTHNREQAGNTDFIVAHARENQAGEQGMSITSNTPGQASEGSEGADVQGTGTGQPVETPPGTDQKQATGAAQTVAPQVAAPQAGGGDNGNSPSSIEELLLEAQEAQKQMAQERAMTEAKAAVQKRLEQERTAAGKDLHAKLTEIEKLAGD